ncbi:hypothetical protein ACPV54_20510 [Vibrio mediterranei]
MATVIALKVDIKWMRDILKDHKNRGEWIQISAYRGRQFIVDDPNPVPASDDGWLHSWLDYASKVSNEELIMTAQNYSMTDIVDLAQDVKRLADFQNFVDDSFTRSFKEELSAVLMDKSEELHNALEASNFITLIKASSGVKFND